MGDPDLLLRVSRSLDRWVSRLTLAVAWLALPLLITLTVVNVLARRFHGPGWPALYELGAEVFFVLVMLSFGYAYLRDGHVRVDIVRERMSTLWIAWIEIFGCLAIVIPLSAYLIDYGARSAWAAFVQGEREAATDLPYQWVVKAAVPLGFLLLLLSAVSVVTRNVLHLARKHGAPAPEAER